MMRPIPRRLMKRFFRHGETGQSIIILAIGFIVLLGFVGVVTDVSLMFVRYTQLRRAVDAAAIAAAGQMRQDRDFATVNLAARQFIEFHGLDPVAVVLETCNEGPDVNSDGVRNDLDDPDLCPPGNEQRKLVRVTAQVTSETVFMRLLGWDSITLEASAISETAVLDVVLVMDVSESMLDETTYEDWASIGLGTVFRPPTTEEIATAQVAPATYGAMDLVNLWQTDLLQNPQEMVNRRLTFLGDPEAQALTDTSYADPAYEVDTFDIYGGQGVPRTECTARFWPASLGFQVPVWLTDIYDDAGSPWPTKQWLPGPKTTNYWGGFRPTFDFYGCCNDPTTGIAVNLDGSLDLTGYSGTDPDKDFSDLICQPFKKARDATRLFLQTIDFTRGDRVAFVTFARSAHLLNPYDVTARTQGRNAFIESFTEAVETLNKFVGVRAEPNFYDWDETLDGGGTYSEWSGYSSGVDSATGDSIPIDYHTEGEVLNQYPVKDFCLFQNATLNWPWSIYGKDGDAYFKPLSRYMIPDPNTAPWNTYFDLTDANALVVESSYELWSSCRDTNVGAALREANNALLDPRTGGRTEGAVWVMIMLSDGAAGASDPVRRNGDKLTQAQPYTETSPGSGLWGIGGQYGSYGLCPYGTPANPGELADNKEEKAGYGEAMFPYCSDEVPETRHFCNFTPELARATTLNPSGDPTATQDNDYVTFPAGMPDTPFSTAAFPAYAAYDLNGDGLVYDEDVENAAVGNVYDVDIGDNPQDCDDYYDVDDYARDWADFVGLLHDQTGNAQLPTIFTIGFGLNFAEGASGTPGTAGYVPGLATSKANVPDYLGEELLRYIADVGDNYRIDTDYQQDYLDDDPRIPAFDLQIINDSDGFGARGPCEQAGGSMSVPGIYDSQDDMIRPLDPTESCGNYFNAPSQEELELVFDEIASRMFTRLAG